LNPKLYILDPHHRPLSPLEQQQQDMVWPAVHMGVLRAVPRFMELGLQ